MAAHQDEKLIHNIRLILLQGRWYYKNTPTTQWLTEEHRRLSTAALPIYSTSTEEEVFV